MPIKIKQDVGCGDEGSQTQKKTQKCDCVNSSSPLRKRKLVGLCPPPLPLPLFLCSVSFRWSHLITRSLFHFFFVDFVQSCLRSSMKKRLYQGQLSTRHSEIISANRSAPWPGPLVVGRQMFKPLCKPQVILQTSFRRNETASSHRCLLSSHRGKH